MELLEIRFSYLVRTTYRSPEQLCPIILRIVYRSQRRDIFTGIYCAKEDWQKSIGRLTPTDRKFQQTNKNLDLILRKANDAFDALRFSGETFSIDELVQKIKGKEQRPTLLIEYIEAANKKVLKRVGVEITKATYYKYRRTLLYLQEYLQQYYKAKNFILSRIDVEFLENYFHFLRTEKQGCHNTALKNLSFLKVLLSPAIRSGVIKDDPFRLLRFKAKPVIREFLSQDEIDAIQKLDINSETLRRKKDIFLFACYTGLAFIDIKQLNRKHLIRENDGSYYILKPRQKTGQESIIPLLPPAERILRKYCPTNDLLDFKWQVSSNQKMNQGLKEIGKNAKICKVLHMHLARHTFATTVTLGNGVPIETVSRMLGHANIRQTQHYAKVVATKIKTDMLKVKQIYDQYI